MPRLRPSRLWIGTLLAAASLAAGACASLSTSSAGGTRNVAIDNGILEVLVRGEGAPAVVFESGAGSSLAVWQSVLSAIEPQARVFAYNRSGYGRSQLFGDLGRPERVVEALRQGLAAAGVEPPYLLVGHSLGGLYVNLFARAYPSEVAGVVLVDSSHPEQFELLRSRRPMLSATFEASYALGSASRRYELENTRRINRALERAGPFPRVPFIVLSAGEAAAWERGDDHDWWLGLQRDLSSMSAGGQWRVVDSSGHFIQRQAPEAVVAAIQEVLGDAG